MGVIENQFVLWKAVLNIFSRFGGSKFGFLDDDNSWVCVLDYVL